LASSFDASCVHRVRIDTATRSRGSFIHSAGIGITALVTTSVKTSSALNIGRMRLSSRCRTSGSPPTSLGKRGSACAFSPVPEHRQPARRPASHLLLVGVALPHRPDATHHTRSTPGQLSGHSRVISIESSGTWPVRMRSQAERISREVRLGLGTRAGTDVTIRQCDARRGSRGASSRGRKLLLSTGISVFGPA
jgi:hypothetical protein